PRGTRDRRPTCSPTSPAPRNLLRKNGGNTVGTGDEAPRPRTIRNRARRPALAAARTTARLFRKFARRSPEDAPDRSPAGSTPARLRRILPPVPPAPDACAPAGTG